MPFDFTKLTTDVKAALEAGAAIAATTEDGGACNFDGVVLRVPNAPEYKVVHALSLAGITTRKSNCGWAGLGYMINPTSGGQANKRTVAAEAIYKHLSEAGYTVSQYYQMD